MVVTPKQTTVAYRCPHCGTGVMSAVSMFHLRGNLVRLKCTCGKSMMEIEPAADGKVRLCVPCIICPKPHRYTVSEKIFFGEELFVLPCAYSDINIAMMGETNHVKAELARTEMQLLDLMEESGISDFSALHKEADEVVSDPQVLEILTFVIRDLDDEGKIYCNCPHEEGREGDYELEVLSEGVKVTCKRCGATKLLPADSLLDAHEFLNADSLTLE
ncbi:MAG: hypothetical protein IJC99_06540 [Clostridia bacterium]|nr:hypothetical protein [Clostridia bacterium]